MSRRRLAYTSQKSSILMSFLRFQPSSGCCHITRDGTTAASAICSSKPPGPLGTGHHLAVADRPNLIDDGTGWLVRDVHSMTGGAMPPAGLPFRYVFLFMIHSNVPAPAMIGPGAFGLSVALCCLARHGHRSTSMTSRM